MTYQSGGLLGTFTNPRGKVWGYTYGGDGRLSADDDPQTSGLVTYSMVDAGVTREVTKASAEGRVRRYTVQQMLDGIRRRFVLGPD